MAVLLNGYILVRRLKWEKPKWNGTLDKREIGTNSRYLLGKFALPYSSVAFIFMPSRKL